MAQCLCHKGTYIVRSHFSCISRYIESPLGRPAAMCEKCLEVGDVRSLVSHCNGRVFVWLVQIEVNVYFAVYCS